MSPSRPVRSLSLLIALPLMLLFTGCGVGTMATNSAGTLDISGDIHGGQQPVSLSNVYLYAAGTTGNGSAARSMLTIPVISDANGNFRLTGDYTCANTEDQVYLVAQGGNPGLTVGTNNPALVMLSALGRCGDLTSSQFVTLNELTTVAAVWALTPFIKDYADIGAGATNALGIKNGFLNSRLLVDPSTGLDATAASNVTIETAKLNSLANSMASCINSDGTTGCNAYFAAATPSGGTAPTNTLQATLNVVRNPSNKVAAVFTATGAIVPFGSALKTAPNDWTMSMKVTGAGLNSPEGMQLDSAGNVWVANYNGGGSLFSPQGVPFSSSNFGSPGLNEWYDVAVDSYDDPWFALEEIPGHGNTNGSVLRLYGVKSAALTGNAVGYYYAFPNGNGALAYDNTVQFPEEVSADTNGNVAVGNEGNSRGEFFDHTGATVIDNLGMGYAQAPTAVAVDASHGLWFANQGGQTVTHVASDGTLLGNPTCCSGTDGIAVDTAGNAWVSDYYSQAVRHIASTGSGSAALLLTVTGGGIQGPARVAVDAAQDVWVANHRSNSFTHIAGGAGTLAAGTLYSPSTGNGLDGAMVTPFGIAIDATGNLWVSSSGTGSGITPSISMFFGVATPTKTPALPALATTANPNPTAP